MSQICTLQLQNQSVDFSRQGGSFGTLVCIPFSREYQTYQTELLQPYMCLLPRRFSSHVDHREKVPMGPEQRSNLRRSETWHFYHNSCHGGKN